MDAANAHTNGVQNQIGHIMTHSDSHRDPPVRIVFVY